MGSVLCDTVGRHACPVSEIREIPSLVLIGTPGVRHVAEGRHVDWIP
jgi:hypothetical protein